MSSALVVMACSLYVCLSSLLSIVTSQMILERPIACPKNEEYHQCVYQMCHKTCEDMTYPPKCPMMTVNCYDPGCVCQTGYLRNRQGICVNIGDCEPPVDRLNDPDAFECPPNEVYNRCSREACFKSCRDMKTLPPCPVPEANCFDPACVCDVGYLRNDVGLCIPLHECPVTL